MPVGMPSLSRPATALRRALAAVALGMALVGGLAVLSSGALEAQQPAPAPSPPAKPKTPPGKAPKAAMKKPQMPSKPQVTMAPDSSGETVQADLSTRDIPVEADFAGARLVLFGAIENSKQAAAESGTYDIIVVIEGPVERLDVRRKARAMGIWRNTRSLTFQEVPSYYAMISTRPVEEITADKTRDRLEIGFDYVYMEIAPGQGRNPAADELDVFKDALVKLKQREGLYREDQYGIAFIGRSLFRATVHLPANVPVGTFRARVFLFKGGEFLSQYTAPLKLERAGVERFVHASAHNQPVLYGLAAVLLAIGAGLFGAAAFRRKITH